jgi:hypothetical protein
LREPVLHVLLFASLTACTQVDSTLTVDGQPMEVAACEAGEAHGVPNQVALRLRDFDDEIDHGRIFVGEGEGGVAVLSFGVVVQVGGNFSSVDDYSSECGTADIEIADYQSDSVYPVSGEFTLGCELAGFTFGGGATFSACH